MSFPLGPLMVLEWSAAAASLRLRWRVSCRCVCVMAVLTGSLKVTRGSRGVMAVITAGATELMGDVIGLFTAALRMDTGRDIAAACLKLARAARVALMARLVGG